MYHLGVKELPGTRKGVGGCRCTKLFLATADLVVYLSSHHSSKDVNVVLQSQIKGTREWKRVASISTEWCREASQRQRASWQEEGCLTMLVDCRTHCAVRANVLR